MSAASMKTASERSRQLSASSSVSSRASVGARVCARVEERIMTVVRRVYIGIGMTHCYYIGAPGDSHLKDTWPSCNISEVVPRSHARLDCRVVILASPGFRQKDLTFKIDLMFVSVSSADKDAEKIFDSFNRMHMLWRDRV